MEEESHTIRTPPESITAKGAFVQNAKSELNYLMCLESTTTTIHAIHL